MPREGQARDSIASLIFLCLKLSGDSSTYRIKNLSSKLFEIAIGGLLEQCSLVNFFCNYSKRPSF